MEDLNLIGQNLEISTLEELLRQARNREDSTETQDVLAVSPVEEHVEFDKEFFIEEVRQLRCLWDTSNPSYKDRTVKANAWKKLSQIFDRDGKGELKSHFVLPCHATKPHPQPALNKPFLLSGLPPCCCI